MSTSLQTIPAAAGLPELTEAELELQSRARRFVDEVLIPLEEQAELAGGRLPDDAVATVKREAIAANLQGGLHAPEHGGQGWSHLEWCLVEEQLGRSTNAISWNIPNAYNVWDSARPDQIDRYLRPALRGECQDCYAVTEADAGSDPSGIATTATPTENGWRIDGEKWFATSGDIARVFIVVALALVDGERRPTLFVVDAGLPGIEFVDDPPFTHNYPHGHPTVRFTGVEIARDAVLGEVGGGDDLQRAWFLEERLGIAARGVGSMLRLLEDTTAWAQQREQGGQRIYDYQGISFPLADSAADAAAGRRLTLDVARLADAGADAKLVHGKAAMAKLFVSETSLRCADRCVQAFGGRGYMRTNVAERFLRELRVDRIWEGTSEIQRLIVARGLERRGVEPLLHADLGLSAEERDLQERARQFVEEILIPNEETVQALDGRLPRELRDRIRTEAIAAGLNGGRHKPEHGGQGWTRMEWFLVQEQFGRSTNGMYWLVPGAYNVLGAGTPEQIDRYLRPALEGRLDHDYADAYAVTEAGAGSDPAGIETVARAVDGGGWRIDGEKWFVTHGGDCNVYIVMAAALGDGAERRPTLFLIDHRAPGIEIVDDPDFMHSYPHRHPAVRFTDVRVGDDAIIGGLGRGLDLQRAWFSDERLGIAARGCGSMLRLIGDATAWAAEREQGGQRILDYQGVSFPLADCAAEAAAARALTVQAVRLAGSGADPKLVHAKAAMAKLFVSETAFRVADRAQQVFGGRGYMRRNVTERFLRELRVDRIWEGTSEIQRLIVARGLERRGVERMLHS